MTVKQLKEQLIGIPDEAILVVDSFDHSYRTCTVDSTTAIVHEDDPENFGQDFDMELEEGEKIVRVLLFS